MNRRRRLAIVAVAALASLVGPAAAVQAGNTLTRDGENEHGDWWCVAVDRINLGYCQGNPLPERLPLPEDRPRF